MYQQLAKLGSKIAATQLGKKALAEGGKELLKSSVPGAVITTGLSTLTTGNPLAGLLIGATDLGASFGLSRALAGKRAKSLACQCQANIPTV